MNPVANINDTPWWQYILQVLLVVAVAECSYRFIETPFRKGAFGRTIAEDRPEAIQQHPEVIRIYLGADDEPAETAGATGKAAAPC